MNARTKTGLEVLQTSVLLGVLGNVLLRQVPWGLNVFVFVAAFVIATATLIITRKPEYWTRSNIALLGAITFFGAMFVWRDSVELRVADTAAIIAAMSVLMLSRLNITTKLAGVFQYGVSFLWASATSLFGAPMLLADVEWNSMPKSGASKHLIAILRGLIIAVPLVLIFGGLFMAADAAYEGLVQRVFNIDASQIFSHVMLTTIFAWLTAGYFRGIMFDRFFANTAAAAAAKPEDVNKSKFEQVKSEDVPNPDALPDNATILEHINRSDPPNAKAETPDEKKKFRWSDFDNSYMPPAFTLGAVEIGVVLGLINLLFLSFVIVQVPYLFGGMDLVQNTPDFKLAEYARRGFGELVVVAALVLPILLLSHWLVRKDSPVAGKLYKVLAGIQIALLFVIMASAAQRLFLLTGNLGYGMTTVRLYPFIFMIWLAIVFVWFGVTVLRGARQHFAWGALWSAFFVLGATHVLNPDEFIVRTNIALAQQGREFDANYNSRLSDDAVPTLVESLPVLSEKDQYRVVRNLARTYCQTKEQTDLRSWNVSRRSSAAVLEVVKPFADVAGCERDSFLWHGADPY
jgi:hypothetical protein